MTTRFIVRKDLYNGGKCFTKGKTYETESNVICEAGLMEATTINDRGEKHIIGGFWRDCKLVK